MRLNNYLKQSLLALFVLMSSVSMAQVSISGYVYDDLGETMPGVSVMVKGSSNGTITDLDGAFRIEVKDKSAVVSFSFIGYMTQDVVVGNQKELTIKMVTSAEQLAEVVAIGYGNMRKSDLTGAIVSISADDLETATAQSIDQALQGRAAGVQVSTASAAPGGSSSIRIRGTNSLLADGNPLYVIDGFPVEASDMNNFSADNIASVEVLKDASSTAIYGSRGANGVILITTKKGESQKPTFDFRANLAVQDVYREIDVMNGQEFAEAFNEYSVNNGEKPYYDGSTRERMTPEQIGEGTNWFDQIMKTGFIQNYSLSVYGGNDAHYYSIGGSVYKHSGVILGGDFLRFNLNLNESVNITKWLNLRATAMMSRTDTDGSGDRTGFESSGGTLNAAMKMSPATLVLDEHGNYMPNNFPGAQGAENPVAYAKETLDNRILTNLLANVNLKATPIKDLTISVKVGTNFKHEQYNYYLSSKTIEGDKSDGTASITNTTTNYWINENIVNYQKKIKKHRLGVMAGFTMEQNIWEQNKISGSGLPTDDFSYTGISSAQVIGQPIVYKTRSALMSVLGRATYNYDDRYLVTLTTRADGNSGFAKGNKWSNFPSVSGAWRISQENFLRDVEQVSNLKLRLGWGLTGNSRIGSLRSLCLLGNDRYVVGGSTVSGIGPNTIGNKDLRWEKTEMYNVGLDMGFFNNRLMLTAEFYYKYTSDMLMSFDIPNTSGYGKAFVNSGELENKGMEYTLDGRIFTGKFKWNSSFNISFNKDEVKKLYNDEPLIVDLGDKQTIWIREGQPIRQFSGREVLGVFRDEDDVNSHSWTNPETGATNLIQPQAKPGDLKYADRDNDGKITNDDNMIYGSAMPDFTFGFNNQFKYAGFTLDVFLIGSVGNWVYNRTLSYLRYTSNIRNNLSGEYVNRWTPENRDTDVPRIGGEGSLPSFEDASYLRIQNVKLTYNLPKKYLGKLDAFSVFASVDNLYVFTKYSGWDPDVNTMAGGNGNVNVGLDQNSYPRPRTTSVGINLKF